MNQKPILPRRLGPRGGGATSTTYASLCCPVPVKTSGVAEFRGPRILVSRVARWPAKFRSGRQAPEWLRVRSRRGWRPMGRRRRAQSRITRPAPSHSSPPHHPPLFLVYLWCAFLVRIIPSDGGVEEGPAMNWPMSNLLAGRRGSELVIQ